uniref:NADH-ubiquinone oxidoreductase chain 2 n=1 Tax=Acanthemblemaria sp. AC-2023 TaxID=3028466 RepID=A0AA51X2E3_9TELE|nr:NADH dehydrogenase subunit 2 [Acanthemblemaria sp. AC-2023]
MSPYLPPLMGLAMLAGTSLTVSSSHWFPAWMGLELATLAIIPLMLRYHHPRCVEAATKYFLVQAFASALLLFAILSSAWLSGEYHVNSMHHSLPCTLAAIALAIKLGLAPFHTWVPDVLQGLDLGVGLVLSTWQKIAPMSLLLQMTFMPFNLALFIGLTSVLVGAWGGLNQTQTRKLMAFSSTAQMGWIVMTVLIDPRTALFAFMLYLTMTSCAFMVLLYNSATSMTRLSSSWSFTPTLTALAPLVLLSMGGLPPLSGFGMKWSIMYTLITEGYPLAALFAALSSLLGLFFYVRLCYAFSFTSAPTPLTATPAWRGPRRFWILPMAFTAIAATCLLPILPSALALPPF